MRVLYTTLMLVLSTLFASAQKPAPVYISAGQSNADGRAYISEGLPSYMKNGYNYLHYANVTTEALTEFYSRVFDGSQYNSRFAFGDVTNYWIEQALQSDFYGIKCAYGGTAIALGVTAEKLPTWNASEAYLDTARVFTGNVGNGTSLAMSLTQGFKSLADSVLSKLENGYDVKAISWHQGESDRKAYSQYAQNLTDLINYLRNEIYKVTGDEADLTLPFIMGTVPANSSQYNSGVNSAQYEVASTLENVYVIDLSDAELRADNLHLNAAWTEYFGQLVYNKMVEIGAVDGEKIATVKPSSNVSVDYAEVEAVRDWNFATENWSQETIDSLAAHLSSHSTYGYRYSALSDVQLYAGELTLPETEGLYFTASSARIAVNPTKGALCFIGTTAQVRVPDVQPGQFIYVKAGTGKSGSARGIVATEASLANLDVIQGDTVSSSGTVESVYWVQDSYTEPVDAEFTVSGGVSWLYEIKVLDSNPLALVATAVNIPISSEYETYTASYDLDFTDNTQVEAYAAKLSDDNSSVVLTKVEQVKKGEGIVLKRIADADTVKVSITSDLESIEGNMLQGTTVDITAEEMLAQGTVYILGTDNLFQKLEEGTEYTLDAYKAYLLTSATDTADSLAMVIGDNTATAIDGVEIVDTPTQQSIYTIDGIKVSNTDKPGLYIVNGKAVMVK